MPLFLGSNGLHYYEQRWQFNIAVSLLWSPKLLQLLLPSFSEFGSRPFERSIPRYFAFHL